MKMNTEYIESGIYVRVFWAGFCFNDIERESLFDI